MRGFSKVRKGYMADITLCSARSRNALDNGHTQMAVKTGKTGHHPSFLRTSYRDCRSNFIPQLNRVCYGEYPSKRGLGREQYGCYERNAVEGPAWKNAGVL